MTMSRRSFLQTAAIAATGIAVVPGANADAVTRPPVCIFSKHLQFLDYPALAKTGNALGLEGLDLTVRKGGHVLPENVGADLPVAVKNIQDVGLSVPMITTGLKTGSDPTARPILEAASKLGIKYVRVGGHRYRESGNPAEDLAAIQADLTSLAAVAAEFGMTAGYHNHSGMGNFAGPLWDLLEVVKAINSPGLGSNFDVGHATAEGAGGTWDVTARMLAPHVRMMAVKDFVWKDSKIEWLPLGEGVVNTVEFFKIMKTAGFAGPISIHFEYDVENNDVLLAHMRTAVELTKGYLGEAGW